MAYNRVVDATAVPGSAVMKTYNFTVVIEPDEEGFHAYVPALPGCHTFGDTIDEVRVNIAEAIDLHVESMLEDQ
jgi:predicted RNase H-like HicB family nuclease